MKPYINIETGKEVTNLHDLNFKVIRVCEDAILISIIGH